MKMYIRNSYLKIISFSIIAFLFGAGLAWLCVILSAPVGAIGVAALVGWAILARRRWHSMRKRDGSEPGGPERIVWHRFAGCVLILGHMAYTSLNPQYDLHVGSGNFLAVDNWTLILGMMLSALMFRGDNRIRDERDDRIEAVATRWGYGSLILFLLIMLFAIGFRPVGMRGGINDFYLANLLMGLIILSVIVRQISQLFGYARDNEVLR
jgi:hypothetical protein